MQPFAKHINAMRDQYKEVVAVSLVNLHGGEGKLAAAFEVRRRGEREEGRAPAV